MKIKHSTSSLRSLSFMLLLKIQGPHNFNYLTFQSLSSFPIWCVSVLSINFGSLITRCCVLCCNEWMALKIIRKCFYVFSTRVPNITHSGSNMLCSILCNAMVCCVREWMQIFFIFLLHSFAFARVMLTWDHQSKYYSVCVEWPAFKLALYKHLKSNNLRFCKMENVYSVYSTQYTV